MSRCSELAHTEAQFVEADLGIKDFILAIIRDPPLAPYSFTLALPEGVGIKEFLAYMCCLSAKTLYDCELAQLTPNQIETLRAYLKSIGWDVEFKVETRMQSLKDDAEPTRVNYFLIDFMPAQHV